MGSINNYMHGHHASVVKSHARRTVESAAPFIIPHIQPTHKVLDVGCGPGSITIGLAKLASQGRVTGIDMSDDVLSQATALATSQKIPNVKFQKEDSNALPFESASFDVVFCSQVLQHLQDPIATMKEMRRVTKPGGIIAASEANYKSFDWFPQSSLLDKWHDIYCQVAKQTNTEPNAGRHLLYWAKQAGFKPQDVELTWNTWVYRDEDAKHFGNSWVDRARYSKFADIAKEKGLASDGEIQAISDAWGAWAREEDALILIPSGCVVCRVS